MLDRFETHLHSIFSNLRLLDATNRLEPTIAYARKIGLKGLALTDHGCVSGWVKANQIQKQLIEEGSDFKIALGEEGYLVDTRENGIKYHHIIWYAKDKIGAKQIRRLSSIANLNSYFDRGMERVPITKEEVEMVIGGDRGHIILQTACLAGEVSSNILEMESARKIGDMETAEKAKQKIINFIFWAKEWFGDDFYLEVAPAAGKEQIIVNKKMVELAQCFNLKLVLGSDAHYLRKEDRYVHEAFLNSRGGERETAEFYSYAYLQTEEEIIENLTPSIVDIYEEMCKNSMEIYDKIEIFDLSHPQQIPHVAVENYPKKESPLSAEYPILNSMFKSDDEVDRYWVNKCYDKLVEIGKDNKIYLDTLEEEADIKRVVGEKLGTNMYSYPVTLSKYIDLFWEMGSPVGVGRGSAGTGLNHYLLGITSLDPVQWKLDFWRYMNRDTEGLGDIDLDLAPSRLPAILKEIKRTRGMNFDSTLNLTEVEKENLGCAYVCTFGTESAKSAVQTAMRGYRSEEYPEGLDNDLSQYLSSLIPVERGFVRTLKDVFEGNKDKGYQPIAAFVSEVEKYPGLKEIMLGVEGMISRKGRHASGVLFLDEDPYQFGAYMRTPSGEVVTQWELHDSEWSGATKFDLLVTEVEDKILQTLKFLEEYNEIEKLPLRDAYNKYLHPDVLPLNDEKVWSAIQRASVLDLFQLDSAVGRQGAKKVKPENIIELSSTNGLIRLMTAEKGAETWLDKYVRYKNNPYFVEQEMDKYKLTKEEKEIFNKYVGDTYGIGISQECIMKSLMDSELCDFTLAEANKARKTISKKKMSEIPVLKEKVFSRAKSERVANYLWDYIVSPSLGYGFSDPHALAYSFIGFQTAYLATKWNPIYWNTSCLVVNSGSLEAEGEELKEKGADYTKIAKAIGAITSEGIEVSLVNINTSDYSFKPDVKNNRILYGLKAISGINTETIEKIKDGRPYVGIKDFMARCPLGKVAMINLIKAGAFDEIDTDLGGDRKKLMVYYINNICEAKKRLTLQNFNGLIQHNLIPKELELQVRVFNFTKYLKANKKVGKYYTFDDVCIQFYERFFSDEQDKLEVINGIVCILQTEWDKIYKKNMDAARDWLKENQEKMLKEYNSQLFLESWEKYAAGTTSAWEMTSMCFYHGEHELAEVDNFKYGVVDFNELSSEPDVDYFFKRGGRQIPVYKIYRIIGTVIAKDDTRHSISLLTTTGVVNVKFSTEYYGMFKRQISQIQPDGSKKVVEKSWFGRGNKLLVSGYRREDTFVAKTYAKTEGHQLYHIDEVIGDQIKLRHERFSGDGSLMEDEMDC